MFMLRKLSTKDVNIEGLSKDIFVNERLTPVYRTLFGNFRKELKKANY